MFNDNVNSVTSTNNTYIDTLNLLIKIKKSSDKNQTKNNVLKNALFLI